ncbi:MAG: hypothetical protein NVSMB64_04800 [Candidatus Velthaea sp.]
MNDEGFEQSADMRLVDLQRQALGIAAPQAAWQRNTHDLPHAPSGEPQPAQRGIVLVATVDAQPRSGLIPGALVSIGCAIVNDGDTPADGILVTISLPFETGYRAGTLAIDGAPAPDARAAELFANGLLLGPAGRGERRTIAFKLLVDAGLDALTIAPHVESAGGAIIGPGAIRLTRGTALAPAATHAERPFYEPDPIEAALDLEPLPPPAAESRITIVQPAELPPPPAREPEAVSTAPPPPIPEAPIPEATIRGSDGPVLTVTLDRKRLDSLRALFGGRSLGMIAHYLVLNALATSVPLPGDGEAAELAAFIGIQERLLLRALVATRLGKPPTPDSVAAPLPPFPPRLRSRTDAPALPQPAAALVLARAYTESEIVFIGRMVGNSDASLFLRAAQLFVGLCANDIAIVEGAVRRRTATVMSSYAALAAAEINRIFLRAKLTRAPALFKETEPAFDAAAKSVLDALHEVMP